MKNIRNSKNGIYTGIIDDFGMEGIVPLDERELAFAKARAMANIQSRQAQAYVVAPTKEELEKIDVEIEKKDWKKAASEIEKSNGFGFVVEVD